MRAVREAVVLRVGARRQLWVSLRIGVLPRQVRSQAGVEAVVDRTEEIWVEFGDRLRAFVARRVGNASDAEDIVQDVFLRIHTRLDTLDDEGKLTGWVYQITRNAIADHYRRRRPAALPDSIAVAEAPPEDVAKELLSGLGPMLERLTAEDREALLLTEVEGLTQRELAHRLGLSLPGAKSRVQRARRKLRQAFMDCCRVEFDRRGGIADYQPGCAACRSERPGGDAGLGTTAPAQDRQPVGAGGGDTAPA